ncbi:MAG TPA: GTPase domain-containing protein [Planctomycetota bacterium]|nr:GTPase domain-containing protein [Planctomycetota bacterium]
MPHEVIAQLLSVREKLAALRLPPEIESRAFPRAVFLQILTNLERRLAEGLDAPLRLAFFGPTGVGKSKLFNSLLGTVASPAGFRRPFTLRPVYSIHESHRDIAAGVDGQVALRTGSAWRDVVLIDTPDFDSVEKENLREAERIFAESEAFLFVTDVEKYADRSTWDYLERVLAGGKPALLVLNKATRDGSAEDFAKRLGGRVPASSIVVIRERPIDDLTPLPEADLEELRDKLSSLAGTREERRTALLGAFRADLDHLLERWRGAAASLRDSLTALDRLRERLERRCLEASLEIQNEAGSPLEAGVKAEVYARVLERIQRIDLLRYPRRLILLPVEGLRSLAGRWWPFRKKEPGAAAEEPRGGKAFQALEGRLLRITEATRDDFRAEAALPGLLDGETFQSLRISHEELLVLHEAREKAFAEWLQVESREEASRLTAENKLKFILSQVIYNSVVVGVQIHTAGHFTLVELATDGVLSPLVAKAVGMAVSSERVREFEVRAAAEHHRLMREVIDEAQSRFARRLEASGAWRPLFESAAAAMDDLARGKETRLAAFTGKAAGAPRGAR